MKLRPRVIGLAGVALAAAVVVTSWVVVSQRGPAPAHSMVLALPVQPPALAGAPAGSSASATPLTEEEQVEVSTAVRTAVDTASPGTELGLMVYDRLTGSTVAADNPDRQFYSASVVKLLMAIDLLQASGWQVGDHQGLLDQLLGASNDGTADLLWSKGGNREIVREMTALLGLKNTTPPNTADQWEMTRLSAQDVVTIYEYIEHQIPEPARSAILSALTRDGDRAADGFNQFFGLAGGPLAADDWAVKQGWMRAAGFLVLNSTGVVGEDQRFIVALLTHQPSRTSYETGSAAVTAGVTALAPFLTEDKTS